ncbi:MAG TPA: DNA adenine methylase [Planctomycetota bacterium]|nr:DNA adenine methylase [Planctomycetota bacterium]
MRYDPRQHTARHTDAYVFSQLVPYLGSKRHLLDLIGAAIDSTGLDPAHSTFVDAFAGSGVVSRYAKQRGFAVVSNDWEPYARVLNTAAIACDEAPPCATLGGYEQALEALNATPDREGWVTNNLCPADDTAPDASRERLFYRRATGRRLDAIRSRIAEWQHDDQLDDAAACCLLAPLLYQACWLANTSGVFKGFHAGWGGSNGTALHRILADLRLSPARFLATGRPQRVLALDAELLPTTLEQPADLVYLDPPYNQHPYASNYHVLNSLVLWDEPVLPCPTTRGSKAAIRTDWPARRSAWNHRSRAHAAYERLLARFDAPFVLTSYSTDGTIPVEVLVATAGERGALTVFCRSYKRYRTSPTRPSARARNVEFVLCCDTRRARTCGDVERVLERIHASSAEAITSRK